MIMNAYLYDCPVCGAKVGTWCVDHTSYAGYVPFTTPHPERIFPPKIYGKESK